MNIQLKENTPFEKYQMAVRVLEAMGIEVQNEINPIPEVIFISDEEAKLVSDVVKRTKENCLYSEKEAEEILSKMWEKWL